MISSGKDYYTEKQCHTFFIYFLLTEILLNVNWHPYENNYHLFKGMETLSRIFIILTKGDKYHDLLLAYLFSKSLLERSQL